MLNGVRHSPATIGDVMLVTLTLPLRVAVPSLGISSIPKNAIGFSFEGGRPGVYTGVLLLAGSLFAGLMLQPALGLMPMAALYWLIGTTGTIMIFSASRQMAFVKPLCTNCRLLPVIHEHEATHIGGIASDPEIWGMVSEKYDRLRISLDSDPSICSFCPIPKRLSEH